MPNPSIADANQATIALVDAIATVRRSGEVLDRVVEQVPQGVRERVGIGAWTTASSPLDWMSTPYPARPDSAANSSVTPRDERHHVETLHPVG